MLATRSIQQIATTVPSVFAFRVTGTVDRHDLDAMAKVMEAAFERIDRVSMLVDLTDYTGSEPTAPFDLDIVGVQIASLIKIDLYAVVGAPSLAAALITGMDRIIPVRARTFPTDDLEGAWAFVKARPA